MPPHVLVFKDGRVGAHHDGEAAAGSAGVGGAEPRDVRTAYRMDLAIEMGDVVVRRDARKQHPERCEDRHND